MFVWPVPSAEEIDKLYESHSYHDRERYQNTRISEGQKKIWKERLSRINPLIPEKGDLLDIGCATGHFLLVAQEDGWKVTGMETSERAASQATALLPDVTIKTGYLPEISFDKKYDMVTMWAVIEHFSDPQPFLKQISENLLKEDGLLVLSTPSLDSYAQSLVGSSWRYFVPPYHLLYFRKKSLEKLLNQYGFKVVGQHSHFRHIAFFKQGSWAEKAYKGNKVFRLLMKIVLTPFEVLSRKNVNGDTLEVIAKRA